MTGRDNPKWKAILYAMENACWEPPQSDPLREPDAFVCLTEEQFDFLYLHILLQQLFKPIGREQDAQVLAHADRVRGWNAADILEREG